MSQPAKVPDAEVLAIYAEPFLVDCVPREHRLAKKLDVPPKVVLRAMERAWRKGMVDYGVTLRSGWLTDKGRALLETSTKDGER